MFAVETEQDYNAEMETVLDTSINGIIKINRNGIITNVNKKFEMLINETGDSLISKKLTEVVTEIDEDIVNEILSGTRDIYSASVRMKRITMIATIVPVLKETEVRGAILSCYRFKKQAESVDSRSTVSTIPSPLKRFFNCTLRQNIE